MHARALTLGSSCFRSRCFLAYIGWRWPAKTWRPTSARKRWTLKSFPKFSRKPLMALGAAAFATFAAGWLVTASGALPKWIRNIEARTEIEAAFFRLMALPGGEVAFRRPPSETRPALGELLKKQPGNAELYSLRALAAEQQLDFTAAEGDWKS